MPTATASLVFCVPFSTRPDNENSWNGSAFGAACSETGTCGVQSSWLFTIVLCPNPYFPDWSASWTENFADALTALAASAVAEPVTIREATRTAKVTARFMTERSTRRWRRLFGRGRLRVALRWLEQRDEAGDQCHEEDLTEHCFQDREAPTKIPTGHEIAESDGREARVAEIEVVELIDGAVVREEWRIDPADQRVHEPEHHADQHVRADRAEDRRELHLRVPQDPVDDDDRRDQDQQPVDQIDRPGKDFAVEERLGDDDHVRDGEGDHGRPHELGPGARCVEREQQH